MIGFLEGIRDSGVRASEIVRNMLDFSRSSGTSRSPRDLNELLDKAVALASSDYDLKKRYDFRKVEIVRAYDPDLPTAMVYETEGGAGLFEPAQERRPGHVRRGRARPQAPPGAGDLRGG